jgi:hypothetical protein
MKLLEKKIYGFSVLELGLGAFVVMNLGTIKNLFGLVSKPIDNTITQIQDTQIQNQTGISKNMLDFCKALAPKIYTHLDSWNTDEEAICKLIGNSVTTQIYWDSLKSYYELKYSKDLVSELSSALNGAGDYFSTGNYKKLLKHSFITSELF